MKFNGILKLIISLNSDDIVDVEKLYGPSPIVEDKPISGLLIVGIIFALIAIGVIALFEKLQGDQDDE